MGCVPGDPECEGDEQPRHRVTLSRGFWLGRTEVTVGAFGRFVARTGHRTLAERSGSARVWAGDRWSPRPGASWRQPGFPQDEDHPVVCLAWEDAEAFCRSSGGRLPTEAEWERAARGGEEGAVYTWGNGPDPRRGGEAVANVPDESAGRAFRWQVFQGYDDGYVHTSPVGSFPAAGFGLHDMAGNAAEWVADWYGAYARAEARDPPGPPSGRFRVVRGGSWSYYPRSLRLSARLTKHPGDSQSNLGFRCALASLP